jgi:signal transduction histidine kinase
LDKYYENMDRLELIAAIRQLENEKQESETLISTRGTQQESGTGLGLRLSHEMVTRNQGRLWVQSSPNQGTVFYISLPR